MLGSIWIQTVCHYTNALEASFQCLDILAIHGKYHTIFHVIAPFAFWCKLQVALNEFILCMPGNLACFLASAHFPQN